MLDNLMVMHGTAQHRGPLSDQFRAPWMEVEHLFILQAVAEENGDPHL